VTIHEAYAPILRHFRRVRLRRLYLEFGINEETRILDVGGSSFLWDLAHSMGLPEPRVTILNMAGKADILADATALPFADGSFDLAFSNSVIEHLFCFEKQVKMAAEIRRVGKSFWVQTPDVRFPVEPHYMAPFIHWMPRGARHFLGRWMTPRGWMDSVGCSVLPQEVALLSPSAVRRLFPDAVLVVERFAFLPKSIIAVRNRM